MELSGGTIDFANSGGEIIVKNGMSVGPLTLKGVGTLALNGFISGWHDEDRINVISGATLSLSDNEHVEPVIDLGPVVVSLSDIYSAPWQPSTLMRVSRRVVPQSPFDKHSWMMIGWCGSM